MGKIHPKNSLGFTIVELLVIIVVITVLATITIMSYIGVQDSAKATAIAAGSANIQNALENTALKEKWLAYPDDDTYDTVKKIIDGTAMKNHLPISPVVPGYETEPWKYDNDLDSKSTASCTASDIDLGVNIYLSNISRPVQEKVDKAVDDGDLTCGKVRRSASGELWMTISRTSATF